MCNLLAKMCAKDAGMEEAEAAREGLGARLSELQQNARAVRMLADDLANDNKMMEAKLAKPRQDGGGCSRSAA